MIFSFSTCSYTNFNEIANMHLWITNTELGDTYRMFCCSIKLKLNEITYLTYTWFSKVT